MTTDAITRPHACEVSEIEKLLTTHHAGLSDREVQARFAIYGPNELPEPPAPSGIAMLVHQVKSPLIYILVIAAAITLALGEHVDAAVIAAVVVLNTAIGYVQEHKAEGSVRALMKLVSPHARVVRGGREREIESRELVPGDVVLLESGARVPADLRLVSVTALTVDESLLTGESVPVHKSTMPARTDAGLADRPCMAYTGSVVAAGRGRGYVVATDGRTELGAIAREIRFEERRPTPLQLRMDRFGKIIGAAVAVGAALAFFLGILLGHRAEDMFMLAVAVAVSAVPESLPVILTITLAVGVRRMARRNAILRRLDAVETLGSTTVIGSDKTGTLTENKMTVEAIWSDGETHEVPRAERNLIELAEDDALYLTLLAGVLTNEAELYETDAGIERRGDPTEVALLEAARQYELSHEDCREEYHPFAEIPFEPERQYSASVRSRGSSYFTFVKGAPERVLAMCGSMHAGGAARALDRDLILTATRRMAERGLRVLATAYSEMPLAPHGPGEVREPAGLRFLGLIGMMDPPRVGVREAIVGCQAAGMRVVMITGDHAATARAIGAQLGIAAAADPVISGRDLATMSDDDLDRAVAHVAVFARVAPEDKLRIVRALQRRGEVVAVTGDGVNDAPALKAAEIGIAMGRSGTDVAREAADMVLADDNFVNIYGAVEEGRVVFDNIRKVTFFLIGTGAAALLTLLAALLMRWPIPFVASQLLWLNLVANGLLDIALAFEPGEKHLLRRPPRPRSEGIITPLLWERTALAGLVMAAGTLLMFRWSLDETGSLAHAQTVGLTTMVLFNMFHVGNCRSERLSMFQKSPLSNRFLFVSAVASLGVHIAALYLAPTQYVLRVEPILDWQTWFRMVATATTILMAVELHKLFRSATPSAVHQSPSTHDVAGARSA